MPLFSRQRQRKRRVSVEKTRTPGSGEEMRRHALRGLGGPILLGALFAALLVFVMILGQPPLRYFVNDTPATDVRARVAFQFVDEVRTQEEREKARQGVPPVYRSDPSPVETAGEGLRKLLEGLARRLVSGEGSENHGYN